LVELVVLGSGTGIPSLRRGSPGLAVISQNSRVVIDSGSGSLGRMLEAGITYRDIDLLLYTHIHPDHIADLVPLLFASKYGDLPRQKDLLCVGGPGFKPYFDQLKTTYGPWIHPSSYHFALKEMGAEPLIFRDLRILSKPMAHIPESVGYRIEFNDGKSMAISGDTDYCASIVELASGVDLLVLECSFPEGKKVEGHLTPSLAGSIALESGCKKLLLTHFYPVCDEYDVARQCREVFQGEILLAEDLMRIRI